MNDEYDNAKTDREMLERHREREWHTTDPISQSHARTQCSTDKCGLDQKPYPWDEPDWRQAHGSVPRPDGAPSAEEAIRSGREGPGWAGRGFGGKALPAPVSKLSINADMSDIDLVMTVIAVAGYSRWDDICRCWVQFRPDPPTPEAEDVHDKPCMSCSADAGQEVRHTEAEYRRVHSPSLPGLREWYARKLGDKFTRGG